MTEVEITMYYAVAQLGDRCSIRLGVKCTRISSPTFCYIASTAARNLFKQKNGV